MARADAKYTIRAEDKTAPGLRSAETRLQRFRRSATRGILGVAGRIAGPLAAVSAVVGTWAGGIASAAREMRELDNRAKDLGVSIGEIGEIDLAAQLRGATGEDFARALERIDDLINQVRRGESGGIEFFDELGINAEALANIEDATDRVAALADAFAAVQDTRRRGALVEEFGVPGRLFAGGGEGIRRAAQEAQRLGLTDTEITNLSRFTDSWTKLLLVFKDRARRLKTSIPGVDVATGAVDILTNTLAGQPAGSRQAQQSGTFNPLLRLPQGASNDPKAQRTRDQQLRALQEIRNELRNLNTGYRR